MSSPEDHASLEGAIRSILDGTFPQTSHLDTTTSNKVIHSLCSTSSSLNDQVIETIAKCVSVTEINLAGMKMTEQHIRVIASQNLTSLTLGYCRDLVQYQKGSSQKMIDLDALLKDMLNQKSREQLEYLDLSTEGGPENDDQFACRWLADGWTKTISTLLPSLTHLLFRNRDITTTDFQSLCSTLPNLQLLHLTNTNLTSLTGISNLQNLHTLRIGCLLIKESSEVSELFELQELRTLRFVCNGSGRYRCKMEASIVNAYMESEKNLEKLEFADFSFLEIEDGKVENFVKTHPNLKTISVCGTNIQTLHYPNLTVLHSNSIKATVQSLEFYINQKDIWMIEKLIDKMDMLFEYSDNNTSQEDIQKAWSTVTLVLQSFGYVEGVRRRGVSCFEQVIEFACLEDISFDDRVQTVNVFLDVIAHSLPSLASESGFLEAMTPWTILENRELILETPNIDYNRLATLAMLFLEASDKGDEDTRPHLMILDLILERVDPESEGFEMFDVLKVLENLQTISRRKDLDVTIKDAAKNAMNFVLNNFPVMDV